MTVSFETAPEATPYETTIKSPREIKDLVIVMAGDGSLHEQYALGRDTYDLWVIYYGASKEIADRYSATADRFWQAKGLKIELVRKIIIDQVFFAEQFDFNIYRFVFLPDDDIRFAEGSKSVKQLFVSAAQIGADIFQSAIQNEHFSLNSTRLIHGAFCHRVTWIEIMMPGFRSDIFTNGFLAGVHLMEFIKSGWGIEPVTMKLGEAYARRALKCFVIDSIPAVHTRPPGQSGHIHELGKLEGFLVPQSFWHRMKTLEVYESPEYPLNLPRYEQPAKLDPIAFERRMWVSKILCRIHSIAITLRRRIGITADTGDERF